MLMCRGSPEEAASGSVPVYLNVYDLTPVNGYAYWLGLGVYHSGIQVLGVEYAYGAHEYPSTGIFESEPKNCEGFTFRRSILIGKTAMGKAEVKALMEKLSEGYRGNTYHLITKNCNHFCNDACVRLTGNPIPSWVNRLARIGKAKMSIGSGSRISFLLMAMQILGRFLLYLCPSGKHVFSQGSAPQDGSEVLAEEKTKLTDGVVIYAANNSSSSSSSSPRDDSNCGRSWSRGRRTQTTSLDS